MSFSSTRGPEVRDFRSESRAKARDFVIGREPADPAEFSRRPTRARLSDIDWDGPRRVVRPSLWRRFWNLVQPPIWVETTMPVKAAARATAANDSTAEADVPADMISNRAA